MCSSHNHIIAVPAYHRSINTTTRERKVETCNNESAARGDKRYQQLEGAINDCLIGE
ncbi:hypothetical protein ACSBR2_015265 [Camellia fascicularis]